MLTSARFSGCFGRSGGRNDAVGHRDAEVKLVGLMFPPQERIDRRDSVQLSQIQPPRRDKDSRKHSSDRTAKAPSATVTVSNRTVTEPVGTARPSATHSQHGGDFTVQHSIYGIYSIWGGWKGDKRGPSPRFSRSLIHSSAHVLMSANRLSSFARARRSFQHFRKHIALQPQAAPARKRTEKERRTCRWGPASEC